MSNDNSNSISSLIDAKNVVLVTEQVDKTELIKKLCAIACKDLNEIDSAEVLGRVLKREEGITTTLDTGLSIPHCRADEVNTFHAAMAVIPAGIKDPLLEHTYIKVMFLFVSPTNPVFFQPHLQLLAELSEKFKDSYIVKLTQANNVEEILKIIKE